MNASFSDILHNTVECKIVIVSEIGKQPTTINWYPSALPIVLKNVN